jgi:hypothetical protein
LESGETVSQRIEKIDKRIEIAKEKISKMTDEEKKKAE